MLRTSESQMGLLRASAREAFVKEMAAHLARFALHHHRVIGEDGLRTVVLFGLDRAAVHGFTWRGPVRLYLELMFIFGSRFDTDPQLPSWAAEVLRDRDTCQMERARTLYEGVMNYLDQVAGEEDRHAAAALSRLARFAGTPPPVREVQLADDDLFGLMRSVYPEKYEYLGKAPHRALIAEAKRLAAAESVASVRGHTLFCLLMFSMGHRFHDDPQYPWIERALRDEGVPPGDARADRLAQQVKVYCDSILENLGRR
jgi:hypothetical protein